MSNTRVVLDDLINISKKNFELGSLYLSGLIDLDPSCAYEAEAELAEVDRNIEILKDCIPFSFGTDPKIFIREHAYSIFLRKIRLDQLFSGRVDEAYLRIDALAQRKCIDGDACRKKLIELYQACVIQVKYKEFAEYTMLLRVACETDNDHLQNLKLTHEEFLFGITTITQKCQMLFNYMKSSVDDLIALDQNKNNHAIYRRHLTVFSLEYLQLHNIGDYLSFIKKFDWLNFKLEKEVFSTKVGKAVVACKRLDELYSTQKIILRQERIKLMESYQNSTFKFAQYTRDLKIKYEEYKKQKGRNDFVKIFSTTGASLTAPSDQPEPRKKYMSRRS